MTFHRWSPTLATARSVATRIDGLGGDDHGFLWRLNSCWRYQESGDGVVVSLESLTLSRDVPWLIKADRWTDRLQHRARIDGSDARGAQSATCLPC